MDRSPSVPMNHATQQMPGYIMPPQGFPLPPSSFLSNQYPCIRVEVKLVNSKTYPDCNTDLSVITIVKKPTDTNNVKTIAEFGRCLLTDCAPDWILKLARRHSMMRKRAKSSIFLCFGGGYDLLVLLEGAEVPKDISKVPRISVSTAISTRNEESRLGKENLPIASYSDGVWDHVSAMATTARGAPASVDMVAVLSDSSAPFGAIEGLSDRVKVIRVWTQPKSIYEAIRFDHTQNLDLSKMSVSNAEPPVLPKPKTDAHLEIAEVKTSSVATIPAASSTSTTQTAAEPAIEKNIDDGKSVTKETPILLPNKTATIPSPKKASATANLAPAARKNVAIKKDTKASAAAKSNEQKSEAPPGSKTKAVIEKKRGRPKGSKVKPVAKTDGDAAAVSEDGPSAKKPKTDTDSSPKKEEEEKSKATVPEKATEENLDVTAAKKETAEELASPNEKKSKTKKDELPDATEPQQPKKKKSRPSKLSVPNPTSGAGADEVHEESKKKKSRSKGTN